MTTNTGKRRPATAADAAAAVTLFVMIAALTVALLAIVQRLLGF